MVVEPNAVCNCDNRSSARAVNASALAMTVRVNVVGRIRMADSMRKSTFFANNFIRLFVPVPGNSQDTGISRRQFIHFIASLILYSSTTVTPLAVHPGQKVMTIFQLDDRDVLMLL